MAQLFSGRETPEKDAISSDPLTFTTAAGIAGVVSAVLAALTAILDKVNALNLNNAQFVAVVGVIGLGMLAFALASAGDAIARGLSASQQGRATAETAPAPAKTVITLSERLVVECNGTVAHAIAMKVGSDDSIEYLLVSPHRTPEWKDGREVRFVEVEPVI